MSTEVKTLIKMLREKFDSENGAADMTDKEILMLLLSYTNCSGSVDSVVENIYDFFGSYKNCFLASYEELMRVDGITHNAAMLILLIAGVYGMPANTPKIGQKITDVEKMFFDAIGRRRDEQLYIATFDDDFLLTGFKRLAVGSPEQVELNIREVVEFVTHHNSRKAVIAHTHPGVAMPTESFSDSHTIRVVGAKFKDNNIQFIGHVIVTDIEAKLFPYDEAKKICTAPWRK